MKFLAANPLLTLGLAMAVFLAATSSLRAFAGGASWPVLAGALCLYTLGNLMMVPLMKAQGMAVAMSASAILQLLLATLVAVSVFGERPLGIQWAGMALGIVAVTLVLWPEFQKP
jgi:small multidrug resistance pump